jgi:AcrR family transcriptional regulator
MVRNYKSTQFRQKQIVDAARKVIIKYGSEHVTVKKIAKEVGISETAIYRHFQSKRDILLLLVDYIEKSLFEDVNGASTKDKISLEVLHNVLKSHLSSIEQRRGISFQIIAEIISLGDKKLNKKIAETIERYIDSLKVLLVEGVKNGEIRTDLNLDAAATALFGTIQGLVNIWALNNYNFDPKERYELLWNIFKEAMIKR